MPRTSWLPCLAAATSMFLICMDTLIVNVALPAIEQEMGGGTAFEQWVVDGYTLPFATLLLLGGSLSDRFGSRRAFRAGVIGFGVASLVCALAGVPAALIAGRVLLGASAALVMPSSLSIINESYQDGTSRARALALWGVGGSAAAAVGPVLGGMLVGIHWSLVFLINLPICAMLVPLCRALPPSAGVRRRFDLPGQLLSMAGLACLVFAIIEGGAGEVGAGTAATVGALGLGLLAAFVVRQRHAPVPVMPLSLLRPQGMRAALFGGFAMILNWNGALFVATLFLQDALGLSSFESGLAFVPSAVTCTLGNLLSERLAGRLGQRRAILAGVTLMGATAAALVAAGPALDAFGVAAGIALIGGGGGLVTPLLTALVLESAPSERAGVANALFNTFRQLGGAIGIACFGALVSTLGFGLGLHLCFAIACALMLALFAVVARLGEK